MHALPRDRELSHSEQHTQTPHGFRPGSWCSHPTRAAGGYPTPAGPSQHPSGTPHSATQLLPPTISPPDITAPPVRNSPRTATGTLRMPIPPGHGMGCMAPRRKREGGPKPSISGAEGNPTTAMGQPQPREPLVKGFHPPVRRSHTLHTRNADDGPQDGHPCIRTPGNAHSQSMAPLIPGGRRGSRDTRLSTIPTGLHNQHRHRAPT
jgi:hypothetical protein